MILKGKVAMITGSASGLGAAIAKMYAKEGAKLCMCDINLDMLKETARKIENEYATEIFIMKVDVTKRDQVEAFSRKASDKFNKIDILVNNAGVSRMKTIIEVTDDDFDFQMDVNVKGCFLFMSIVAKIMQKNKGGKIINISSCLTKRAMVGTGIYTACKMALLGLSRVAAAELGIDNITVNCLLPGMTLTDMVIKAKLVNDDNRDELLAQIPLGRFSMPIDQAKAALFLASDLSDFMTGETLNISGGRVMTH